MQWIFNSKNSLWLVAIEAKNLEISSGKNTLWTMVVPGAHSERNGLIPRVWLDIFAGNGVTQRMIKTSWQRKELPMTGPSPQSNGTVCSEPTGYPQNVIESYNLSKIRTFLDRLELYSPLDEKLFFEFPHFSQVKHHFPCLQGVNHQNQRILSC